MAVMVKTVPAKITVAAQWNGQSGLADKNMAVIYGKQKHHNGAKKQGDDINGQDTTSCNLQK